MDQDKLINDVQEEILNRLPAEAIERLASLADDGGNHDEEAKAILAEYNINAEKVAKEVVNKENKNGN